MNESEANQLKKYKTMEVLLREKILHYRRRAKENLEMQAVENDAYKRGLQAGNEVIHGIAADDLELLINSYGGRKND